MNLFYFNITSINITQCNSLDVKWSDSQLNQLKEASKNATEVTLKFSSNIIGDSNDKTNFPHELLLTDRQVSKLRKIFANNSSPNIKLSKTQLSKIVQSVGFLGRILGPLIKIGLSLMVNVLKPLTKRVLIQLELTATASAWDVAIQTIFTVPEQRW